MGPLPPPFGLFGSTMLRLTCGSAFVNANGSRRSPRTKLKASSSDGCLSSLAGSDLGSTFGASAAMHTQPANPNAAAAKAVVSGFPLSLAFITGHLCHFPFHPDAHCAGRIYLYVIMS